MVFHAHLQYKLVHLIEYDRRNEIVDQERLGHLHGGEVFLKQQHGEHQDQVLVRGIRVCVP